MAQGMVGYLVVYLHTTLAVYENDFIQSKTIKYNITRKQPVQRSEVNPSTADVAVECFPK
jgi:hypothetical protein